MSSLPLRAWPITSGAGAAGTAGAAGAAAPAAAVADCDSAWEGSQKLKIGAAKRPFRVGGVAKVGDPTPQNGHSAWEGSQNLYIGNLPIVRLWRLLPCITSGVFYLIANKMQYYT